MIMSSDTRRRMQEASDNQAQKVDSKSNRYPSVTGTSVLGLKCTDGVVLAADMLGSYGSMARFRNLSRVMKVNDTSVIGASGDYADYQFIKEIIEQRVIEEECLDDGFGYTPKSLFSWLSRVMYNRRSNINPLWNTYVVAGMQEGEPFLGYIDKIGVAYEAPSVASGYGAYIAQPLMRAASEKMPTMTVQQATEVIDNCMKVLFYRDARSLNKYEVAVITKDGVEIKTPVVSQTNWEVAEYCNADERTTEKPRRCITNLSTEKLETITIKSKDDEWDCAISGMAVTNTGTILLADWNNYKIKSVSSDNKVLSVLSLPERPRAITVLDTTTAVVAAFPNKLYIVNISDNNTLSLRGETQLEYDIWAMVSYNGNIVVICHTRPWTVKQITIKGEVLWSVDDHAGQQLFIEPHGITIIKGSAVVVVSDFSKKTLTVLEAETGGYIRAIGLGEEKEPRGITVDNDSNVYVCYRRTREIGVWSNDFKESKILVSGDKLGKHPRYIEYSAVDDSLYVSYSGYSDSRNTVDRFRLV